MKNGNKIKIGEGVYATKLRNDPKLLFAVFQEAWSFGEVLRLLLLEIHQRFKTPDLAEHAAEHYQYMTKVMTDLGLDEKKARELFAPEGCVSLIVPHVAFETEAVPPAKRKVGRRQDDVQSATLQRLPLLLPEDPVPTPKKVPLADHTKFDELAQAAVESVPTTPMELQKLLLDEVKTQPKKQRVTYPEQLEAEIYKWTELTEAEYAAIGVKARLRLLELAAQNVRLFFKESNRTIEEQELINANRRVMDKFGDDYRHCKDRDATIKAFVDAGSKEPVIKQGKKKYKSVAAMKADLLTRNPAEELVYKMSGLELKNLEALSNQDVYQADLTWNDIEAIRYYADVLTMPDGKFSKESQRNTRRRLKRLCNKVGLALHANATSE